MKFNQAIELLKEGEKVRRPSWEEDSYWKIGIDEVICWKDGTIAHVHLNQINADDWEIYKEKQRVIISDDNILMYAKEFLETWKKICETLDKKKEIKK